MTHAGRNRAERLHSFGRQEKRHRSCTYMTNACHLESARTDGLVCILLQSSQAAHMGALFGTGYTPIILQEVTECCDEFHIRRVK